MQRLAILLWWAAFSALSALSFSGCSSVPEKPVTPAKPLPQVIVPAAPDIGGWAVCAGCAVYPPTPKLAQARRPHARIPIAKGSHGE